MFIASVSVDFSSEFLVKSMVKTIKQVMSQLSVVGGLFRNSQVHAFT